jgi:hypothetical protein
MRLAEPDECWLDLSGCCRRAIQCGYWRGACFQSGEADTPMCNFVLYYF